LAYALGGFSNFFLHRPFVADAVFSRVVMSVVAFVVIRFFNKEIQPQAVAAGTDWRMVPAAILILFALWILAALALACSTRLDTIATLAICSAFFLAGIVSDYIYMLLGGKLDGGGPWWASVLYTVVPNWQLFWMADLLDKGTTVFPWSYVGKALIYVACYAGAALALAVALFEERELN
jgi:ABC-type transport system involved in multi-copper enzyme maturation permease subunit